MFVVTVNFVIKPAHVDEFAQAMIDNARASRKNEPGCRHFDVCRDADDPTVTFLYEIYDSEAAFKNHLAEPHFKSFDAAVAPWIATKKVKTWVLSD